MNTNPAKVYSKDVSTAMPNCRVGGASEFPNLNTNVAPYLPLQFENERHDEHYVILNGKVLALDSFGYLVPAGLRLQHAFYAAEMSTGAADAATALAAAEAAAGFTFTKYTQVDVDNSVLNAAGVAAQVGEPVVHSMFVDSLGLTVSHWGSLDPIGLATVPFLSIGNHIGVAAHNLMRNSQDSIPAGTGGAPGHDSVPGASFEKGVRNSNQLRHYNYELAQARATVLVSSEVMVYPIRADRSGVLVRGQSLAIAPLATFRDSFARGSYVTYNEESDIIPATAANLALLPDLVAVTANPTAELFAAGVIAVKDAIVGQVIDLSTRYPSSLLNYVKTRWDSTVTPGFDAISAMPGSATGGLPWSLHTAGANISEGADLGQVKISLLMR